MKYLKSFKIYESKDLIQEDLKSDIENILVDLIDDKIYERKTGLFY